MQELGKQLRHLAENDPEKLATALAQLSEKEAESILYDWRGIWARPNQLIKPEWEESVILFIAGRGFGKDLADTTPILTQNRGWVNMGSIEVGDVVFDEKGQPTKVLDKYSPSKRKLYRLVFSDGHSIVSSCEHDWVTWTHRDRKAYLRSTKTKDSGVMPLDWVNWRGVSRWGAETGTGPSMRTTQEVVDTFTHSKRGDRNHSIPTTFPVQFAERTDLPIDPYIFGLWLGDGSSNGGGFACGVEDADYMKTILDWKGYKNNMFTTHNNIRPALRELGVLNNKFVPEDYLYASEQQRLELLQGLMDSDGYASKNNHVEFCNTKENLARAVEWLAISLGDKPIVKESRAMLYGKDCGPKYRVTWKPSKRNPFKLPRKRDRISLAGSQSFRNHHRMVISYEEVDWEPTTCIEVDSDSHLFLAGKGLIPTHNTRVLSEYLREVGRVSTNNVALVGSTASDTRDILVLGDSGILNVCPESESPEYEPSKSRLVFPSGCVVNLMSAESPERARGGNRTHVLADELGSWNDIDMVHQLMLSLRKGESRFVGATTPRATETIKYFFRNAVFNDDPPKEGKFVRIISGSTYENLHNLSKTFRDTVVSSYEGTRLGKQELEGKLLLDAEGALWTTELIVNQTMPRGEEVPELDRVVIAIDPAVTTGKHSDKTGIVVAGLGVDEYAYVIGDFTGSYTSDGWVQKVLHLYDYYSSFTSCSIAVERNQGGDMLQDALTRNRPFLPIDTVFATKSKISRAQPVAMLFEQGKVFLAQSFSDLESEMTSYEGKSRQKSPDRLDAMVMAVMGVMPTEKNVTSSFELMF